MNIVLAVPFILIISILFILSIKNPSRNYRNECVSIGMLGTFVGITISLFYFDSTDLTKSLPSLLEGLKFAFITSGFGMIASSLLSLKNPDAEVSTLERLVSLQEENNKIIESHLSNVSEGVSQEIVKSLEEVMSNFNHHIENQLGQNFKELNEAFTKLVKWQDDYQASLDKQYSLNNKQFESYLNKIDVLRKKDDENKDILNENLNNLIGIFKDASDNLKHQSEQIDNIINNLKHQSNKISTEFDDNFKKLNSRIKDSVEIAEENISALIAVANGKIS